MGRTGGERTSNGAKPPDTVDIINARQFSVSHNQAPS